MNLKQEGEEEEEGKPLVEEVLLSELGKDSVRWLVKRSCLFVSKYL